MGPAWYRGSSDVLCKDKRTGRSSTTCKVAALSKIAFLVLKLTAKFWSKSHHEELRSKLHFHNFGDIGILPNRPIRWHSWYVKGRELWIMEVKMMKAKQQSPPERRCPCGHGGSICMNGTTDALKDQVQRHSRFYQASYVDNISTGKGQTWRQTTDDEWH